ncbi:MAG TPA: hypothetical protein VJZ03_04500 [Candidatus Bathyarchaeia archaeon]|nr:hypothetical protein [Candidatus Bathyarchaeia archaeon]
MSRNITRALALLLLALMALGFSTLSVNATGIASHSGSMTIITGQTTGKDSGLKIFTVIVSSHGFNGSSNTLNLDVSQGDQVSIKFVYNDPTVNTAHEIAIDSYNIQSAIINKANPISIIQFVAGQVGSFLIHCIIPCIGMENLQNAWLLVKQSTGALIGTVLTLRNLGLTGSVLNIITRVTDKTGNPLTGLIVSFYVSTDFGMMKIGDNVTDTNGMAHFAYPLPLIRKMTVAASFPGSGIYQSGNATASITPSNSGTVFVSIGGETNHPPGGEGAFFDPRLVGVPNEISVVLAALVLIVIVCVWSTFAYVVSLVLKIRKHNSKENGGS